MVHPPPPPRAPACASVSHSNLFDNKKIYICRGLALEPENPELLLRAIQLYHLAAAFQGGGSIAPDFDGVPPPSPVVARVLAEEAEGLLGAGGSLDGAVAALVALAEDAQRGSLGARVCAARALWLLSPTEEARGKAVGLVRGGLEGRGVTVGGCAAALAAVEGISAGVGGEGVEELREACRKVFPIAEAFGASSGVGETVVVGSG